MVHLSKRGIVFVVLVFIFVVTRKILQIELIKRTSSVGRHSDQQTKQPNILLVVADDLGFNDIGYHGSNIKTPYLDNLALSGVRLENYYVQATSSPTRAALLTGRYPIHTGVQRDILPGQPIGLPLNIPTLADKLKEEGYSTHMVGKWHLGFHKRSFLPTRRGFDSYFGSLNGRSDHFTHISYGTYNMSGIDLFEKENPANSSVYEGYYSTILFADKSIDIIRNHDSRKPIFLYLSFQALHQPLQVPKHYINQTTRNTYQGMVSCLDEAVGNVTKEMKQRGLWENTIVVFTSVNGGSFASGASNWPLRGYKDTGWEGGIRAVGFVYSDFLSEYAAGSVFTELMHVTDWFPTLLNLAQRNLKSVYPLDGVDQWKCMMFLRYLPITSKQGIILNNASTFIRNSDIALRMQLLFKQWEGVPSQRTEILHDILPRDRPGEPLAHVNLSLTSLHRISLRAGEWKCLKIITVKNLSTGGYRELSKAYLYNIVQDMREENDLSSQFRMTLNNMLKRVGYYHREMVPSPNPQEDPLADPRGRSGFWEPWND